MKPATTSDEDGSVPVLLIIFNRPDTTSAVIERLRAAAPREVFVFADGPRAGKPEDIDRCQSTRAVLQEIDWPCTLRKLFLKENAGCPRAVFSAVTWFFREVPRGIILEDDCVPSDSFFPFCRELLERYDSDERVYHISGWSPHQGEGQASYQFDHYMYCWGWAGWARAWKKASFAYPGIEDFLAQGRLRALFDPRTADYLEQRLGPQRTWETWDIRWLYSILHHGGCCITPGVNLVHNIGFPADSAVSQHRALEIDTDALIHPDRDDFFTWAQVY